MEHDNSIHVDDNHLERENSSLTHLDELKSVTQTVKANICSALGKTCITNVNPNELYGKGSTKVSKESLAKHLLDIINSADKFVNCFKIDNNIKPHKLTSKLVDTNQSVTDMSHQISENSHRLESINKDIINLSKSIDSFKLTIRPLSSSEALSIDIDVEPSEVINEPVNHAFKHIDDTSDNFIAPEKSQELLDFFSKEEFISEGGHGVATYGASYKYMGSKAKPKTMPACLQTLLDELNSTQTTDGYSLNSCLVNKFVGPESGLPEHSDDEYSINPKSHIFTITLGDTRTVTYKDVFSGEEIHYEPKPNSLYVMSRDSQNLFRHRIDKDSSFTGIRYSITFRCVHWRFFNSTCIIGDSNTKHIEFGSGKRTVGESTPGDQVFAAVVKDIDPLSCTSYSNVVLMVGTNDLRNRDIVSRDDIQNIYKTYKRKILEIQKFNKMCKIYVVPVIPTKLISVNRKIIYFNNSFIYNDLVQSCPGVTVVGGTIQFADKQSNLLSESLSLHRGDVLHLGSAGLSLLIRIIKQAIFQRKKHKHSGRPLMSSVVRSGSVHPPR